MIAEQGAAIPPRRDRRCLGLHRRRAAAAVRAAPRRSTSSSPPATPQAGTARGRPLPEPGRRLSATSSSSRTTRRGRRRPRRRVLRPAPRHVAGRSCPTCSARVGLVVDLGADFRLKDAGLYPHAGTARSTPRPQLLAEFVYGLPELFRDGSRCRRSSPPPAATSRPPRSRWRRCVRGRAGRADRHRRRRRQRRVGRRPAGEAEHDVLHRRRGLHRLRAAEPPPHARDRAEPHPAPAADAVLFTPHLAPMNRGILATCYARPTDADVDRRAARRAPDAYAAEPFVVVRDGPRPRRRRSGPTPRT